jgi:hypothetical protein
MMATGLNPRVGMRAAAWLWMLSSLLPAGVLLLASSEWGPLAVMPSDALIFGGSLALACLSASFFVPARLDRLVTSRILMGFGLSSLLFMTGGIGFAFLLAPDISLRSKSLALAIFLGAAVLWCNMAMSSFKRRIEERRFLEREFSIHATKIVLRHPVQTDLDASHVRDTTLAGKLYHRAGPYLVMGIPMAYPIQRLLTDTGGMAAVLLLLAVLGLPLTIYILGRLTCGAYLWVYKVWQMERQYGKPVVFAPAE